jgi:gamma-glutamyltranspeptidase/glutathione hydrolase
MPIDRLGHNSPEYVHAVVEALKLSFADRERYYGDPEFVQAPLDELLSDRYAERRRALIDPSRAWPELPPSGDGRRPIAAPAVPGRAARTDTSYLCAIDAEGNIFSATFSDSSYDAPVVPGLGIPMSTRGSQAWLNPAHPNSVQPRKRPMITPNPVLVLKDGTPYMAIGSPGGDVQPQAMVQVLLNMLHFGMDPQQAVEAPRFSTSSVPDSFTPHRYEPGVLRLEAEFPTEAAQRLSAVGHRVVIRDPESNWLSGGVCVAMRDGRGLLSAGADPRRACYAIGW